MFFVPTESVPTPTIHPSPTPYESTSWSVWHMSGDETNRSGVQQDLVQGNSHVISGNDTVFLSEKPVEDFELNITATVHNIHDDQPFTIYFNSTAVADNPTHAYYALTFTRYAVPGNDQHDGPKWRIVKHAPEAGIWYDKDFFAGSPLDAPLEGRTFSVLVRSRTVFSPHSPAPLRYVSVSIDGYVVCSIVDERYALGAGHIGFGVRGGTELLVEQVALTPIQLPTSPNPDRLVIFGDSIVFGENKSRSTTASSQILREQLALDNALSPYEVLNYGYPGEKVSDTLETKWDEGVLRFEQVIDLELPAFVIIEEGTNNDDDPALLPNLSHMIDYARQRGVFPLLCTLTPVYDGRDFTALNQQIRELASEKNVLLVDLEAAFVDKEHFRDDTANPTAITSPRQLISKDGVHPTPDGFHKIGMLFAAALRHDVPKAYEAAWVSQGIPEHPTATVISLKPGETQEVMATFRNTGTIPWFRTGPRRVGFYVYRDHPWSTPHEYNDPASPRYGTDFFAHVTWGSSFDGATLLSRAADLMQDMVLPGEEGTFSFTFAAPVSATPNPLVDDATTPWDERWYRSDFSLASGADWIANHTNGDQHGVAHTWFAIRVVPE